MHFLLLFPVRCVLLDVALARSVVETLHSFRLRISESETNYTTSHVSLECSTGVHSSNSVKYDCLRLKAMDFAARGCDLRWMGSH